MTTLEKQTKIENLSNKITNVQTQLQNSYLEYLNKNKELNQKLATLNEEYQVLTSAQTEDIPQIKERVISKINSCDNIDLLKQIDSICTDNTPAIGTRVWGYKAFRNYNGKPCRVYGKKWDDIYSERGLKEVIRLCYGSNKNYTSPSQTLSLHIVQMGFPKMGLKHYNKAFFQTKEEAYNKAIAMGIPAEDIQIIE